MGNNNDFIVLIFLLIVLVLFSGLGIMGFGGMMPGLYIGFGWIFMIINWVIVIIILYYFIRLISKGFENNTKRRGNGKRSKSKR